MQTWWKRCRAPQFLHSARLTSSILWWDRLLSRRDLDVLRFGCAIGMFAYLVVPVPSCSCSARRKLSIQIQLLTNCLSWHFCQLSGDSLTVFQFFKSVPARIYRSRATLILLPAAAE